MTSTFDRVAEHAGRAVAALGQVNQGAEAARQLLGLLGWALPAGADDIGLAQLDVSRLAARLEDLATLRGNPGASDAELAAAVAEAIAALADTIADIEHVVGAFQPSPDYLSATGIADQFFGRLSDLLVIHAIGSVVPVAVPAAALLGIFELTHLPADASIFQVEHVRQTVRWDRLSLLFSDPAGLMRDVYGWGTTDFRGNSLVANIGRVMEFIATDIRLGALPRQTEERLVGRDVPEADTDPSAQLFVSLDKGLGFDAFDAGLSLFALRAGTPGGTDGGIGLAPYAFGTVETRFDLSDHLSLALSASTALQGGIALMLRAGNAPSVLTGLFGGGDAAPGALGDITMMLRAGAAAGQRKTLFSAPSMVVDAAAFSAGLSISTGGADLNPALLARIEDGRIRLASDDADGFIASLLPSDGITAELDLDIAWSHREGVHIKGGAGLSTVLALNRQAGPLRLSSVSLAMRAGADGLSATVGVAGTANIGPLAVSASGIGATVALRFGRGNLGPVDLGASFQPPSGIGLSVDAQGVLTGGGFLFHDPAQGLYAGAMQLSLHERITLKAFGLIATRMPGGSRGYSMLIFITAEDFQPIPLGLGFNLLGIGGMVGVNRTFDQEVLRQGLKNGTLATLLFPRDPVGNATSLMRSLASAFPARRGSYLLGILAKIGWFTPTLVLMDLALILEFGARQRLLALGRISALPSAGNDLVRLNMEAMGVIDFDAGTAAIDAVLVDSRLAHKFAITGAAALRAGFGSGPSFVLAVGGLNPHYTPPAGFPALNRVAIALSSGNNPRLVCEAYFAITSNTVQFGARASLYASAAGFSIEGDVGFDVLVQLAPLHFIADYHARLQLKRGKHNLFMVDVAGEIEGPRPLRLSGKASFKIFWFHFSVRFDTTLVHGEAPPLPAAVDVLAQLTQALTAPASWRIERTAEHPHGVALRSLPPSATLVLDPLGRLSVTQQVVPLNTGRDVDTFGGAPVSGARRFGLAATLNGTALESETQQASFAPAQYFTMSDDEKLVAPSFETMDAGCIFGSAATKIDPAQAVAAPLGYRTITVGEEAAALSANAAAPADYTFGTAQLAAWSRSGAAARAPVRQVGRARFRNSTAAPAASLQPTRWSITPNGDGAALVLDPSLRTWSECRAAVDTLNRARATWQMLPTHELEA
jgi:hypothetical protein